MAAPGNVRRAGVTKTDWETPPALFGLLDREFRFTLDAAASDTNHKCERYLTEAEDALTADIFDHVVFCNPPYGGGLEYWVQAFRTWAVNGNTVVALLPANTDTDWFRMVWIGAAEIRLLYKRVQFIGGGNSNTGGSIVAIFRPEHEQNYQNMPVVRLWKWR